MRISIGLGLGCVADTLSDFIRFNRSRKKLVSAIKRTPTTPPVMAPAMTSVDGLCAEAALLFELMLPLPVPAVLPLFGFKSRE